MRLPIPSINGKYRLDKLKKRPISLIPYVDYYGNIYTLDKEIHKWMKDNKIEYQIFFEGFGNPNWWVIEITDLNKALLYKLTWG